MMTDKHSEGTQVMKEMSARVQDRIFQGSVFFLITT